MEGPTRDPVDEIQALRVLDEVKDGLMPRLLVEGVEQFQNSWQIALAVVDERLASARAQDLAAPA